MLISALRAIFRPTLAANEGADTAAAGPAPAFSGALSDLPIGRPCQVTAVIPPSTAPDWGRWLAEIGFIAGEPAVVTARSPWGDGGLVVRIGSSNFALRRDEACCVSVRSL